MLLIVKQRKGGLQMGRWPTNSFYKAGVALLSGAVVRALAVVHGQRDRRRSRLPRIVPRRLQRQLRILGLTAIPKLLNPDDV